MSAPFSRILFACLCLCALAAGRRRRHARTWARPTSTATASCSPPRTTSGPATGRADLRRLTTYDGTEYFPHFSPDGTLIAFTGEYDGNRDVYVIPAAGGEPRRLTWHPAADEVIGWSPDGSG